MLGAACSSAMNTPCTMTWTGGAMGTADCTGAASDELLALQTNASSLNWLVSKADSQYQASFQYQVPNPPADSYSGGTTDTQFCIASLIGVTGTSNPGFFARSRENTSTGSPAVGSCGITFTSKTDTSSSSTKRFTVHGTATATLISAADAGVTSTLTVTF